MDEEISICSTCLKSNTNQQELTRVTDLDYDGIMFIDKLRACVSSELEIDQENIAQMCQSCRVSLNLSYKFRETVLKSLRSSKYDEHIQLDDETVEPFPEHKSLLKLPDECIIMTFEDNKEDDKDQIQDIIEQMREEALKCKEELSCPQCSSNFRTKDKLQRHIAKMHNKGEFTCMVCESSFKTSFRLKEHVTSHTGEKDFQCTNCEKAFPRLSSLKRHMKSHYAPPGQKTKKTPFLCTICGKSFPFSNGAARHMRIHLGVKTHECEVCHKKFNQSTHLQVHLRTHSGEKPYICENCGECFTLKAGLHKHLKTRHKNDENEWKPDISEESIVYDN